MIQSDGIVPVKKTQSKFLDQLIQQQCTVNDRNRAIHEQTMHLKNSMMNGDSTYRYYSQTTSSQAKKKANAKHVDNNKQRKKQKRNSTKLTQPKAFVFHSSSRSSSRSSSKRENKPNENDQIQSQDSQSSKVVCESNAKPSVINQSSKDLSQSLKPKSHFTKVVGFTFATDSRFNKKSQNSKSKIKTNQTKSLNKKRNNGKTLTKSTTMSRLSQRRQKINNNNNNNNDTVDSKKSIKKPSRQSSCKDIVMKKYTKSSYIATKMHQKYNSTSKKSNQHKLKGFQSKKTSHITKKSNQTPQLKQVRKPRASTSNIVQHSKPDKQTSKRRKVRTYKRQRSLTNGDMKKMLDKQISSNENTDWNKIYISANRKRSNSLTRSSSRSSLSQQPNTRRKGRSASFNFRYADFVENFALDALLTDDASRISDEDLKELSQCASQNASRNTSPLHNHESQLTFAQLLDHDINMSNMSIDDDYNQQENNIITNSDLAKEEDDIITDVKDRFLKLDYLFGQISAAIQQDESSWIQQ